MSDSLYSTSLYGVIESLLEIWFDRERLSVAGILERASAIADGAVLAPGREEELRAVLRLLATDEQWTTLPALVEFVLTDRNRIRREGIDLSEEIRAFLGRAHFAAADLAAKKNPLTIGKAAYARARQSAVHEAKRKIERAKKQKEIEKAEKQERRRERAKQRKLEKEAAEKARRETAERERTRREEAQRVEREKFAATIRNELDPVLRQSILEADRLNSQINKDGVLDYAAYKSEYLTGWLSERFSPPFPKDEQVVAIGDMSEAFLLKARAGSGKTSVITAKARLLLEHEKVPPDQVLILAFNRAAAEHVTRQIRRKQGIVEFNNARTFHSLAWQIVNPTASPLFDEKSGYTNKQSEFVQRLIRTVMNPALLAQIYTFFRQEIKELEDIGAFLSDDDYYVYRRNHVQDSLGGQPVKSGDEKWIADFLFEHDIRYVYEHTWLWDDGQGGTYRPDFSLFTDGSAPNIVIEHWGIDLNDENMRVPDHWTRSWEDYREEIDRKRSFWNRYNARKPDQKVLFLETSIADTRGTREEFEDFLRQMLKDIGVDVRRLPEEELYERVVINRISRMAKMCLAYIQKAKKLRLSPDDMSKKIKDSGGLNVKTASFLRIANNLYRRYQDKLAAENLIDFDDLIGQAAMLVHESRGELSIRVGGDQYVRLNDLRWIMIDEYQDFSNLFFDLIDAIRTYNRKARLFCVGDDWQAINAFAGSDLEYFEHFQKRLRNSNIGHLQNNYRSAEEIVGLSNKFMLDKGVPSIATRSELKGKIAVCRTDKEWIEWRSGEQHASERKKDERFRVSTNLTDAKILKVCNKVLSNKKYDSKTTFAILSRTDRLSKSFPNLAEFKRKLKSTLLPGQGPNFREFDKRVQCRTIHRYKGLEADVVIVVAVNDYNFPKIHPDNELFAVLGVTPDRVLAEEERLFYVALTRARKDLYLLTETGSESEFLDRLALD